MACSIGIGGCIFLRVKFADSYDVGHVYLSVYFCRYLRYSLSLAACVQVIEHYCTVLLVAAGFAVVSVVVVDSHDATVYAELAAEAFYRYYFVLSFLQIPRTQHRLVKRYSRLQRQ